MHKLTRPVRKAIVRPPGESFSRAISQQVPHPRIDVRVAHRQHIEYCATLQTVGLDLIALPPDEEHPDACFVQDTAVVFQDVAVLGRFGPVSRQGEERSVRRGLHGHRRMMELRAPATLEGGDVLIVGSRIFVGLSTRTNRAGYAQLRELLEPEGATVEAVPVPSGLHLLSGCSYLGHGVLLATAVYADLHARTGLDLVTVPVGEEPAANALAVGSCVVLPAGHPRTTAQLHARGFHVLTVTLTEFAKADGGVTCLALLL